MCKFKFSAFFWLPLLILVLALGFRAYRAVGKDSLFVDENLSVVLSNYGTYGYSWPVVAVDDDVKTYEGSALRERIFHDDNSLHNILYDLWNLRKSTRDTPHTNLYYSCLRLGFWGADTADLSDVVRRGFIVNAFLFSLGFFFLFKLSRLLFEDKWIPVLGSLIIFAFNPISVSNTIFLREYQLQESMLIIFTFLLVLCAKKVAQGRPFLDDKKSVSGLMIFTSLSLLSGYFGVPYVLMMWSGLGLFTLMKATDKLKEMGCLIGVFVGSVILTFILYPAYLDGFSGDRGEQAVGRLSVMSFVGSLESLIAGINSIVGVEVLILLFVCLLVAVFFLLKKKSLSFEQLAVVYIIGCSILWMLFSFYLAPVKEARYIASIFPLLYLIFPFALFLIKSKKIQIAGVILLFVFFFFKTITYDNVYWGKADVSEYYNKDVKTPLIIGGVYSPWLQTSLTPYFTDAREVTFTFNMKEFISEVNKYDELYVILGGENMSEFNIPEGYVVSEESIFVGCVVDNVGEIYKIERN